MFNFFFDKVHSPNKYVIKKRKTEAENYVNVVLQHNQLYSKTIYFYAVVRNVS